MRTYSRCSIAFQCSSASRKFLNLQALVAQILALVFQCSSASRKFLNKNCLRCALTTLTVSVLFSEPKIPQWKWYVRYGITTVLFQCSSASRKFLNSLADTAYRAYLEFQCSSASRKFLNCNIPLYWSRTKSFSALQRAENSSIVGRDEYVWYASLSFSALQRAENSSIQHKIGRANRLARFQCSSASRKFLNWNVEIVSVWIRKQFQCSSASRKFLNGIPNSSDVARLDVSVLFSEPKIPQWMRIVVLLPVKDVSVLFSEPKIPQFEAVSVCVTSSTVSVLFSEPKIPQSYGLYAGMSKLYVSVLFSEPKIPQSRPSHLRPSIFPTAMITLRHS